MQEAGTASEEPQDLTSHVLEWALRPGPRPIPSFAPLDAMPDEEQRIALSRLLAYARRMSEARAEGGERGAARARSWVKAALARRARLLLEAQRRAERGWARFQGAELDRSTSPAVHGDSIGLRQLAASRGVVGVSRDLR